MFYKKSGTFVYKTDRVFVLKTVAVILTFNEERHLERCIASVRDSVSDIVVIDSFSTDRTLEIASTFGARVLQNAWVNYADQFNWALTQLPSGTEWVLRIDADEVMTQELAEEVITRLPVLSADTDGVFVRRQIVFQGRRVRFGGTGTLKTLRLFRYGRGQCERRWMDEHIKVQGKTMAFRGALIDINLKPLTWWVDKHNGYASREAIDLLNLEFNFMQRDSIAGLHGQGVVGFKRWLKEKIYFHLPLGTRAFLYFIYRFVFRLGFLDGSSGVLFHVLQGFWYRYLVDQKVAEVKRHVASSGGSVPSAILDVLGVDVLGKIATEKPQALPEG